MRRNRSRAILLAVGLVAWNASVGPALSPRTRTLVHAGLVTVLAHRAGATPGLSPRAVRRGATWGLPVAATAAAAVAVSARITPVRRAMAERQLPAPVGEWLLAHIPVGTVYGEEMAYRAVLGPLAENAFGPHRGRLVQAAAFGLSHVADARATGEPVAATVAVTGAAGWGFGWLHARSGSVIAPMLAHLALNEAGAIMAWHVQRRRATADGRLPDPAPVLGHQTMLGH